MISGATMTNNPFTRFGVKRGSASSFNLARADMALWGIQYGLGIKGTMSVAAARGIGTEDGVAWGLKNPEATIEECIAVAVGKFNELTALTPQGGEARDKQRALITGYKTSRSEYPGFVRVAVEALRPIGKPSGHGELVTVELEKCPVPVIGYKDFSFDDLGFAIDLKTTERMPTTISQDHRLQLGIYNLASGNQAQRVAYCTPKEATILELSPEDAAIAIAEANHIAQVLNDRLAVASNPEEFIRNQIPDFTSFRWHETARAKAAEIFGF